MEQAHEFAIIHVYTIAKDRVNKLLKQFDLDEVIHSHAYHTLQFLKRQYPEIITKSENANIPTGTGVYEQLDMSKHQYADLSKKNLED